VSAHPRLPGRIADRLEPGESSWRPGESRVVFDDPYLSLTVDEIVAPDGSRHSRVVVRPRPAVGVIALDEEGRVLLVEQYRHPMRRRMLEIPAGLMDVEGETARQTAERELAEEADLRARDWSELIGVAPTVGYSTETITLFRACGLSPVPEAERTVREAEEADLTPWWVDLDEAVRACFDGRIRDAKTVIAILAVARP